MVTVSTPTSSGGSALDVLPVDYIENLAISVASDTMVELLVYDNRNYQSSLIHILNSHASKSLIYNIFGSNDYNAGAYPTFNAVTTWKQLLSADKTLTTLTNGAETLTDNWAWIAIAMKQGVAGAGNESSAKVRIRALK